MAYLELTGRLLLVLVFAVAVVGKVRGRHAFEAFVASVGQFGIVPRRWTNTVAASTVVAEAAAVLALAVPVTVPVGYLVAGALATTLTVAVALALRGGRHPTCRCFGATGVSVGRRHVVRNVALALVAALGLAGHLAGAAPVKLAGAAVAGVSATVLAALVVRLDDLVALFSSSPPASATSARSSASAASVAHPAAARPPGPAAPR